ncbi:ABC transporter permease [Wenxinia saemankumensis]|uniref:ABC-type nitrate/sulfonate/bicarbonate transport system, permease component n=1 Tax=Wenxinia saemankumensis TaxID=1447782 RepID=A0A1M6B2A3_9RHOB|nr:ABC transporter permease [Wenxinia saemankumensis]SHI42810.1 ABC-type nitrate/sulfonate/bicarbonate transport system, permease component [Wenxinia saemankumensis]
MQLVRHFAPTAGLALALLLGWEVYCRLSGIPSFVLPPPSGVVRVLWTERSAIGPHALATIGVATLGFGLSVAFAFAASVALHFLPWLRRGAMPIFVASQTIPIVALAPLMILWFGFGLLPKVLLVILVTFFPILVSLLSGYAAVPQAWLDLLRSMDAGRAAIFRRVTLPAARASFLAGLRISATYAIVATIFAEYAGARRGLGIYILAAKNNFRADLVLAAVALSAALTLALLGLLRLADRITAGRFGGPADAAG